MSLNQLLLAKAAGLTTLNQVEIILLLASVGTMPMKRIAQRLGITNAAITNAAITGLMDRLHDLKLIQRIGDPADGRSVLAILSEKGSKVALQINPRLQPA